MYYVVKNRLSLGTVYTDNVYLDSRNIPYIAVSTLPEIKDDESIYVYSNNEIGVIKNSNIDYGATIDNPPDLIQENKLLKAQVQAASDRSDFLEDCIAEMATLVYNTEETT